MIEEGETMKALITGASSGIGRDIARELNQRGYDLVLVARDLKKLDEVKAELKTNVETVSMDISNPENCKQLHENYKNIDILVNNAGFGDCGYFDKTNLDKELQMINTNIVAYHVLTKLYLKDMKEKNNGKILNVASIAGFMPGPHMATYHATKAYVLKLTQSIYEELRKRNSNVKISALCPGPIKTPFLEKANVEFKTKVMTSTEVANYAIDKMFEGKYMILPGANNKMIRFLSKIVPDKTIGKIVYNMETKRK